MNTRQKMYATNTKIRKYLNENGFHNLYFFPHLRFSIDYLVDECGFDSFGWDKNNVLCFFQFKTNKKLPKKELLKYKLIEIKYNCKCFWINCQHGKIVL